MEQIKIIEQAPELQTLYGEMTDDQKKMLVGAAGGLVTGIILFILIRNMKKRKR